MTRQCDPIPVVAVFNSSDDVLELLRMVFRDAGFVVVTAHIRDIRDGQLDLIAYIAQHTPCVVVYDIVPPYEANWRFLQHLRSREPLKDIPLIVTSTNPARVAEAAKNDEPVYEIIEKPWVMDRLVDAVRRAAAIETGS